MKTDTETTDWISQLDCPLKGRGWPYRFKIKIAPKSPKDEWVIVLFVRGEPIAEAAHLSKRRAQHEAAKAGLEWLEAVKAKERIEQGEAARTKGLSNEKRLLAVLLQPPYPLPAWFVGARLADREEDARGIDIVVQTHDLGKLLLQVKSSKSGERKFKAQGRRSSLIGIVVVRGLDGNVLIQQKALTVLEELRAKILQNRGIDE